MKKFIIKARYELIQLYLKISNFIRYGSTFPLRTYKVVVPKSTIKRGKIHLIAVKDASIQLGENVTLRSDSFDYFGGMPFPTTLLIDAMGGEFLWEIIAESMEHIFMQKRK